MNAPNPDLADAVKALNETLKRHSEETSKELAAQMLRLEVTDLELQMLRLSSKLKAAKEKLLAHEAAQPSADLPNAEL